MDALRQAYVEQLPARVHQIESLWQAACEGVATQDELYALYQDVHQLNGSGETFGFGTITEATHDLEKVVMNCIVFSVVPSLDDQAKAREALAMLKRNIAAPSVSLAAPSQAELRRLEKRAMPTETHTGVKEKGTILIAEDGTFLRTKISFTLRALGYKVLEVANGLLALAMARTHHPDLILMDVMMPTMNGLEATRRIRSDVSLRDIPIIIITSKNTAEDLHQAFTCDINDYMVKPFRQDTLIARVKACLLS